MTENINVKNVCSVILFAAITIIVTNALTTIWDNMFPAQGIEYAIVKTIDINDYNAAEIRIKNKGNYSEKDLTIEIPKFKNLARDSKDAESKLKKSETPEIIVQSPSKHEVVSNDESFIIKLGDLRAKDSIEVKILSDKIYINQSPYKFGKFNLYSQDRTAVRKDRSETEYIYENFWFSLSKTWHILVLLFALYYGVILITRIKAVKSFGYKYFTLNKKRTSDKEKENEA